MWRTKFFRSIGTAAANAFFHPPLPCARLPPIDLFSLDVSGGGAGGDDTDGWGDEEDDRSTAVSTNSSAVVVDHPPREDQEHEHRVVGANENVQSSATESDADAPTVADLSRVRPGAGLSDGGIGGDHRRSSGLDDELKQGHGSESSVRDVGDDGHKDGEGDDGWDGWD